jgi:hypothetical protein
LCFRRGRSPAIAADLTRRIAAHYNGRPPLEAYLAALQERERDQRPATAAKKEPTYTAKLAALNAPADIRDVAEATEAGAIDRSDLDYENQYQACRLLSGALRSLNRLQNAGFDPFR